jgi:serine/threonine-protein kinase
VPVYGLGTYGGGRPYYAMRLIKGDSLKEAIERFHADPALKSDAGRRSLELRKLLRRFLDVCNAVGYAHSRGVIHRDLKPANIILGQHGETLVVDWGLAKATGRSDPSSGERTLSPSSASGSAETLPGSALGTPAYMSPEQAEGDLEHLGPRSDVYSLGATLYCLLTGRPPFEGEVADVIRAAQQGGFRPPRQLDPTIDAALEAVCLKAMALRPEDRYGSCRALSDDIERWMADEPVSAWREPLARRTRRWARRNRPLMMAAPVVILVALAGLGAVLAVQARANDRLRRANASLETANAEVRRVNAELEAANRRERERFDLATEAIRRYHTGVSEDVLLKQDQFKDLRDRLLRDAAAFYQKLEGLLSGQTDPRSRRALGRAYEEVGELTDKIGSVLEALAAHRQALEVRRALAREDAPDPSTRADVGRSLLAIGVVLDKMGRYEEALAALEEALAALEEARAVLGGLAGSGPDRDAILGEIARSYYWTGVIHQRNGRLREALSAYEQAGKTAAEPDSVDHQRTLAWCYNNIGMLRLHQGDSTAALAAFDQSRRIKRRIVDAHPDDAEYRRDLADSHICIGLVLRETGQTAEALASNETAVAMFQSLVDAYPAVSLFQSNLANGLIEMGDALRLVGRTAKARASYERALSIVDGLVKANPTVTGDQSFLLLGLILKALKGLGATSLTGGRTTEAVASWRRAIAEGERLSSSYGESLYYLAGCHARLGGVAGAPDSGLSADEGPPELDRAMEILGRAIAGGYRPLKWMRRDPDLDPLRSRPDFQLLMMDLAMPADPFAPRSSPRFPG